MEYLVEMYSSHASSGKHNWHLLRKCFTKQVQEGTNRIQSPGQNQTSTNVDLLAMAIHSRSEASAPEIQIFPVWQI